APGTLLPHAVPAPRQPRRLPSRRRRAAGLADGGLFASAGAAAAGRAARRGRPSRPPRRRGAEPAARDLVLARRQASENRLGGSFRSFLHSSGPQALRTPGPRSRLAPP